MYLSTFELLLHTHTLKIIHNLHRYYFFHSYFIHTYLIWQACVEPSLSLIETQLALEISQSSRLAWWVLQYVVQMPPTQCSSGSPQFMSAIHVKTSVPSTRKPFPWSAPVGVPPSGPQLSLLTAEESYKSQPKSSSTTWKVCKRDITVC